VDVTLRAANTGDFASRPVNVDFGPVVKWLAVGVALTAFVVGARVVMEAFRSRSRLVDWALWAPELPARMTARARRVVVAIDLCVVGLAVLLLGVRARAFSQLPPGSDTWGHIAKIRLLEGDWPHVNWNSHWYGGVPYFQGSYPPGYHFAVIALSRLTGLGVGAAMSVVDAIVLITLATSTYLAAYWVTSSRLAGWVSSGFVVSCSIVWLHLVTAGIQPRTFGLAGFAFAVAGSCGMLHRSGRTHLVMTAVGVGWAMLGHLMVGAISAVLVGTILLVGQRPKPLMNRMVWVARPMALGLGLCAFVVLPTPFFLATSSQQVTNYPTAPWRSLFGEYRAFEGSARGAIRYGLPTALLAVVLMCAAFLVVKVILRRNRLMSSRRMVVGEVSQRYAGTISIDGASRTKRPRPGVGICWLVAWVSARCTA
jgi:hypothetical protein